QTMQGPHGVQHRTVDLGGIGRAALGEDAVEQVTQGFRVAALDEQTLRMHAPQEVGVVQGGNQLTLGRVFEVQHRVDLTIAGDDAVQAHAALAAQRAAVGGVGGGTRRVVQEQVVVPVEYPDAAFGAGPYLERRAPGIFRRKDVGRVGRVGQELVVVPVEYPEAASGAGPYLGRRAPGSFRRRDVGRVGRGGQTHGAPSGPGLDQAVLIAHAAHAFTGEATTAPVLLG